MMCKHPRKCFLGLLCSGRVRNKTEVQAIRNIRAEGNVHLVPAVLESVCGRVFPKGLAVGDRNEGKAGIWEGGSLQVDGRSGLDKPGRVSWTQRSRKRN